MKKSIGLFIMSCITVCLSACVKPPLSENKSKEALKNQEAASYHVELGIRYLHRNSMERARQKLNYAIKLAPNWPPALNAMAYYLEYIGEDSEAERYYKKALAVEPDSPSSQNNYGTYLCRKGQYALADVYFNKAAKHQEYTRAAEAYENAGLCALEARDHRLAEAYFQKALRRSHRRPVSLMELAELNINAGNVKQASQYYSQYLAIANQTPQSLWLGIRLAYRMGQKGKAKSYASELKGKFSQTKEYQLYRKLIRHEQTS